MEVGIRNFIKGYYAKEPYFGLKVLNLCSVKELISFIYGLE